MTRDRVIVVGGGAMGAATAWWLARSGTSCVLLEQYAMGHQHGSSHGRARIFRLAYTDASYVALARRAQQLWRLLEDESSTEILEVTGGLDHGPAAVIDALQRAVTAHGVTCEQLAPEAAAEQWPGMRFDDAVLQQREAGRLHADATVTALHQQLGTLGADVRFGLKARAVRATTAGVEVDTDAGVVTGSSVVLATGAWLPSFAQDLPFARELPTFRVTQEQPGYFRVLDKTVYPSFLHHQGNGENRLGSGAYGMFSPDQGLKVGEHGAGVEVDPDNRPGLTQAGVQRLADYVAHWFPGADPTPLHVDSCLYTSTPDEKFVLKRWGRIVVCSPCSGHGFKFVPAIGERTAALATA